MSVSGLTLQATDLEEGLQKFNHSLTNAANILATLDKKLQKLNKLTAPIHNRATALTWAEHNIASAKVGTDELRQYLSTSKRVEAALKAGPQHDLDSYLQHLSQLDAAVQYLEVHSQLMAAQQAYEHAEKVHQKAMRDCEADFLSTLQQHSTATLPSATSITKQAMDNLEEAVEEVDKDVPPAKLVVRLQQLGAVMLKARHMKCLDVYTQIRTKAINQTMQLVGLEPLSLSTLQVQTSEQLEKTMQGWAVQLRALLVVSVNELHLARQVWAPPFHEAMFAAIINRMVRLLVQQGRDIIEGKRQAEKLFVLLDMNRHLTEVLPLLDKLLVGKERCAQFLAEFRDLHAALAKAARAMFLEFEDGVSKDSSKVQTVDGTVHPLCAHTLSYLRRLFSYADVGAVLFGVSSNSPTTAAATAATNPSDLQAVGDDSDDDADRADDSLQHDAALAAAVVRILAALRDNLQSKAKAYKSPALATLFLMNNMHYMVWTVEQSEHLSMLGHGWIESHKDLVEHHGSTYHELTWMPIIRALKRINNGEDPEPTEPGRWREWVKSKFKAFNTAIEAIYTSQSGWTIPDSKLKAAVRRVIQQDLLPPYEAFHRKYSAMDFTTNRSKYLRYTPGDLEIMIDHDLFEGRQMSLTKVIKNNLPVVEEAPAGSTSSAPSAKSIFGARKQ